MTDTLAIALAQLNPTVGDLEGNQALILRARNEAAAEGADLVVCTELVVTGYPPEDLVLKPMFQEQSRAAVEALAAATADDGPALLIGAPWVEGGKLYNAVLLLDEGHIAAQRYKYELPNYGVFDEVRVFARAGLPGPIPFRGVRLGAMICEDMWFPEVAECLAESGAEIMIAINGSPFESDKGDTRLNLAVARIGETELPLIYVNQVGGQDELVFDGASFVLNADHGLAAQAPAFEESVLLSRWTRESDGWTCAPATRATLPEGHAASYRAMSLGLRDYVGKNGFPGVLIGLSGGIDSALTAAVAVDALGADRVLCFAMPSRYTAQSSLDDAAECARLLGVRHEEVGIEPAVDVLGETLAPIFAGRAADETEENIQARVRGVILMAISNKLGHMVLTTGNKSEMSVGYATLYGDMCGGYSVLKDVYKTDVFEMARWRNGNWTEGLEGPQGRVIPEAIIDKPPSAELRPDQTDQDSLPPYEVLDDVLRGLVEEERSTEEIVARGHAAETAARIWRMLDIAEYKRRQAPPGIKLTLRSFGKDRRYPITNRYRGTG